jgi:hypothetical protein
MYKEFLESPNRSHRRRRKGNIKMDFKGIGWDGVDWIHLSQEKDCWRALVNTVKNVLHGIS